MSVLTQATGVVYPDTDGQPMAENTVQYRWIVTIVSGLDHLFADDPNVFVAGDLLWYPVEGNSGISVAPDALVALGRPKGDRSSYLQWEEGGIAPQVVFEILSPSNQSGDKLAFYDRYGVEEFYEYDPDRLKFRAWQRDLDGRLEPVDERAGGWRSPKLGLRFVLGDEGLEVIRPDGERFKTVPEIMEKLDEVTVERDAVTAERDAARQRAERLATRMRELGLDPDAVL